MSLFETLSQATKPEPPTSIGDCKGEKCNRNGCVGIIDEHDSEGSCSCHINPPCSHCTTAREYCPECGWEASDDQAEYDKQQNDYWNSAAGKRDQEYYQEQDRKWREQEEVFWKRFRSSEPVTEFEARIESHTNSSQKVTGMYPLDMPTEMLMSHIKGSWGGRFEMHNQETGRFVYIAYTD